jgi:Zn-dependent protease
MTSPVLLHLLLAIALGATAIILHEVAHGYAALALGDETALKAGRLTLNPFKHVDRVGTVLLPGVLMLGQLLSVGRVIFMFGWAKPVPVDPMKFRWPRQMMALVALAGPAMNFSLAFLAAHILLFPNLPAWLKQAVDDFIQFNLVLGLFNLVPVPPLDGGRVMVGVLPRRLAVVWAQLEPFGIAFVMLLIVVPPLLRQGGIVDVDPLGSVLGPALDWAFNEVLRLAGVPHDPG